MAGHDRSCTNSAVEDAGAAAHKGIITACALLSEKEVVGTMCAIVDFFGDLTFSDFFSVGRLPSVICGGAASPVGVPHSEQKAAPSVRNAPHFLHLGFDPAYGLANCPTRSPITPK